VTGSRACSCSAAEPAVSPPSSSTDSTFTENDITSFRVRVTALTSSSSLESDLIMALTLALPSSTGSTSPSIESDVIIALTLALLSSSGSTSPTGVELSTMQTLGGERRSSFSLAVAWCDGGCGAHLRRQKTQAPSRRPISPRTASTNAQPRGFHVPPVELEYGKVSASVDAGGVGGWAGDSVEGRVGEGVSSTVGLSEGEGGDGAAKRGEGTKSCWSPTCGSERVSTSTLSALLS